MKISVIIPAHNEAHRLGATLERYIQTLSEQYQDAFEIIIVANGCSDRTVDVANAHAQSYPQIRVMSIRAALGKGGAILAGIRKARGTRIVFTDADGATSPESLIRLANALDRSDIVIGSRRLSGSRILQQQPLRRRILGRLFALVVGMLFALPYRDTQCGAKALRRSAARRLADAIQEPEWTFDVELLLWARRFGYRVSEQAVEWTDRDGSTLKTLSTVRTVLPALWRMARRHYGAAPRDRDSRETLSILALNWRCIHHPQAGGSEINLFEQARRWVLQGHNVTVFTARPDAPLSLAPEAYIDGIRVIRRGNRVTVYLHALAFLLLNAHRFDRILDVANGIPFFSTLVGHRRSTLLVHHVHAAQWFEEFPAPVAAIGWFIERRLMPLLYHRHRVITVSPTTRDALITIGFAPSQIDIVYNGVTQASVAPAQPPVPAYRILYVGRVKRYKRLHKLVEAVAALKPEFPAIRLDIVGDGDALPGLLALAQRLGVSDHVVVHGFVAEAQKQRLLAEATVFANPSMNEGWGLSVIEANAHGCPAVAYNVPGLSAAIQHCRTGYLADTDEAFIAYLAALLRDPVLRARFSREARRWTAQFNWDTAAASTLEILQHHTLPARTPPVRRVS